MVIGRGDNASGFTPEVDLTSFDAFAKGVSRKHALITIKDQRLMLRDLNSTNGTRLNNMLCKPGEEYRLRHGNELMFGTLRIQVSFSVVPALTDTQLIPEVERGKVSDATIPLIHGNGKRILLIEEDNDVGQVFRVALEYAGYKVQLVNDVTKALGIVFQGMPEAIILDLTVPDTNGLDLVRYVRKQKTGHNIPILVISSAVGGFQMNQALAAGADSFMGKPIAVDVLVQALGKALRGEKPIPSVVPSAAAQSPTITLPR
jgi:CheY-like chemotaxis protein